MYPMSYVVENPWDIKDVRSTREKYYERRLQILSDTLEEALKYQRACHRMYEDGVITGIQLITYLNEKE